MIDLLVISHACFMGINRNIYHLFVNEGWKVELVVPSTLNFPAGRKEAEAKRAEDPPIHYLNLNGDNPRTYLFDSLDRILTEKQPSIILLDNDPVSRLALMVGRWSRDHNAKLFCISCENLSLDILSAIKRRGWKSLPAAIVKRLLILKTKKVVDGVFTINEDGKKIFIEEGYRAVEHMPLGFDPHYFFPDKQTGEVVKARLGLQKPVIAYFGRLTKEKGIHILIKALEGLMQHEWLLMMDDFDEYASDYSKEIHQLLRDAKIIDRVVFVSPNHFEIAGYMNAAEIIVVPSIAVSHWKEQYGRVAAEAMACGKKVIASDSGALPGLLNGYGWLFSEGNVEELRKILKDILMGEVKENGKTIEAIAGYAKEALSINRQKEVMKTAFSAELGNF